MKNVYGNIHDHIKVVFMGSEKFNKCIILTRAASYLKTLLSFSNILMKSFFGGCGTSERQDCRESSNEPNPLYGGISYAEIKGTDYVGVSN